MLNIVTACALCVSCLAYGDEIDIEPYSIELEQLAQIIGKGMTTNKKEHNNNNNDNNRFTVDIPRIKVFKGMTAKNLCQAMIELSTIDEV